MPAWFAGWLQRYPILRVRPRRALLLRQRFAEPPHVSLKALLASAPLDGIELDRSPDPGRDVDL
ncbi:hypothetical protein ACU4GH_33555 [Bradyrhizobium betae]